MIGLLRRRGHLLALLPTVAFLVALVGYPLVVTVSESFYTQSLTADTPPVFAGLGNYAEVLGGTAFGPALLRTVLWTAGSVGLKTVVGLSFALLLRPRFRGNVIYRMLLVIPWATPQVIGAVTWKWMYDGQFGYLNYILMSFGLLSEREPFLGEPVTAFLSVLVVDAWFGVPLMAIIFLAGLSAIPDELYEAARIDGAGPLQSFRKITMPLLVPVFGVATSLSVIWTFNSFNIIKTMTGGGPVSATEILVIRAYEEAFGSFNVGLSATYAVIIFVILLAFSVAYWTLLRRRGEVR